MSGKLVGDTEYYGKPAIDYDIVHVGGSTWTVSDVRGAPVDGTDTLDNVNYVQFADGQRFALATNGITDQTDFAFVVDTTGSMGPYINGVKDDAKALLTALFGSGQTDARVAVVSFKDPSQGDPNAVVLPFTDQVDFAARQQAAIDAIDSLGAYGGGDIPEADNAGLLLALDGSAGEWRDSAAIRRIVLFTDAPVKDTELADLVSKYAHDLGYDATGGTVLAPLVATAGGARIGARSFTLSRSDDAAAATAVAAADAGTPSAFQVQIYTIQVGNNASATESVEQVATANNGAFFNAPTPEELVDALLKVINLPPPPTYAIAPLDAAKAEGSTGTVPFTFTVTRTGDASTAATLTFTVSGAGTQPAAADDFAGGVFPSGEVSFAAGETAKVVTVGVNGDATVEPDEGFAVTLGAPPGILITNGTATGTILDDDGTSLPPVIAGPPAAPVFAVSRQVTNAPAVTLSGTAAAGGTVTVTSGGGGSVSAQADPVTGAFAVEVPLSLGANALSGTVTTAQGTSAAVPLSVFDVPAPVLGISTSPFSSADLREALRLGAALRFVAGTTAVTLTDGVLNVGPDATGVLVHQLYETGLNREVDATTAAANRTALAGVDPAQLAQWMADSPEFAGLHAGQNDADFVASLYGAGLGRVPEPTGAAGWVNQLANGGSRADVLLGIATSPEATARLTGDGSLAPPQTITFIRDADATLAHELYETGLGREIDVATVAANRTVLPGLSPAELARWMVASAEFNTLHANQGDADYVTSLYGAGLGRLPEPAGAAGWISQLANGASRADVLLGIATSGEATQRLTADL